MRQARHPRRLKDIGLSSFVNMLCASSLLGNRPSRVRHLPRVRDGNTLHAGDGGAITSGDNNFNGVPIGYNSSSGSSFVRSGFANTPVIGTAINGGTPGTFGRSYDFSITVAPAPFPAPSSVALAGIGGMALLLRRRRETQIQN